MLSKRVCTAPSSARSEFTSVSAPSSAPIAWVAVSRVVTSMSFRVTSAEVVSSNIVTSSTPSASTSITPPSTCRFSVPSCEVTATVVLPSLSTRRAACRLASATAAALSSPAAASSAISALIIRTASSSVSASPRSTLMSSKASAEIVTSLILLKPASIFSWLTPSSPTTSVVPSSEVRASTPSTAMVCPWFAPTWKNRSSTVPSSTEPPLNSAELATRLTSSISCWTSSLIA